MSTVFERLSFYGPNEGIEVGEIDAVKSAISVLEEKGWTEDEIVSYLRWLEHVDPTADEATALRHMARIREAVLLRLATKV